MENVTAIFNWISANPGWGGIGVFLIAFFESLALVGLVLPGAAMMFGIGAMVGTKILPLVPTLVWAAAGAIAGDGVSFWLGRRYHMQLKVMWPLRRHPELIAGATAFFHRHGGKSILFGRFIGPIRPVIPAVAGMLEMPASQFFSFNVISGMLWAPVYVFPGMLFATSLGLAAEVASRLAVLVGTLLGVVVMVLWIGKRFFNWLHRHTYPLMQQLLWWTRLHPRAGRLPAALLDPNKPEAKGLTILALLLITAALLFSALISALDQGHLLVNLDAALHQTLQGLHTPGMDRVMVVIGQLGDGAVLYPLFLVVGGWLLLRGSYHAVAHWGASLAFGLLLGLGLYGIGVLLAIPSLTQGAMGHTQLLAAMSCYGFLAVLINRELPPARRWWLYALVTTLLLTIAFARLYFGDARLSAVLGVVTLALAWLSLLGIGYRSHPGERPAPRPLGLLALIVLLLASGWHTSLHFASELQRHVIVQERRPISLAQWLETTWRTLPTHRADLRGSDRHPLNLQYQGELDTLERLLARQGWRRPVPLTAMSWIVWLAPETPLAERPVLPQVHDGRHQQLLLVRPAADGKSMLALRLWESGYRIGPRQQTLWIGNVGALVAVSQGGFTVPRTQEDFTTPLQRLRDELAGLPLEWEERVNRAGGAVLLLQQR